MHTRRRAHQEVVVRDVPRIGAGQGERNDVTGAQARDVHAAGKDVLRRAELPDERHGLVGGLRPLPAMWPARHGQDRERLVVPLRSGGPQVMGTAADHRERMPLTALDVDHCRDVPAAVRRHRAAWLDPYRLPPPRNPAEPAAIGRPVESSIRPPVVDGHAATDVDLGMCDVPRRTPVPCKRDHPGGDAEEGGRVEPARQMRVQAAKAQPPEARQQDAAVVERVRVHAERRRAAAHRESSRGRGPRCGAARDPRPLSVPRVRWVDPEQHIDVAPPAAAAAARSRSSCGLSTCTFAPNLTAAASSAVVLPGPPKATAQPGTCSVTCASSPPEETSRPSA